MEEHSQPGHPFSIIHQEKINESYSQTNQVRPMSTIKRIEAERERKNLLKNEEIQNIEKEMEIIYRILEEEVGIEDEHRSESYFSKLFLQEFTIALTTLTCKII
jgi:hypothetical protein